MNEKNETSTPDVREAYHTPTLRDHGTVSELTLAGGSAPVQFDGAGYSDSAPHVTS